MGPTFAFLDPDGMELRWETLETLAKHKSGSKYKVELWMLFPSAGLMRTPSLRADPDPQDFERATRLFGNDEWRRIFEARSNGLIGVGFARESSVNLMRLRLRDALGYGRTYPLEIKNTKGGTLYHMLFATDNAAGERIMSDLYKSAAKELPAMRKEALDTKKGTPTLFDPSLYEEGDPWVVERDVGTTW